MSQMKTLCAFLMLTICIVLIASNQANAAPRNKRSDIDAKIFELQAKLMLEKAYAKMLPGHGRINFDAIGKRSTSEPSNIELLEFLVRNSKYNPELFEN